MDFLINVEQHLVDLLEERSLVGADLLEAVTRGGDPAQALDTLVERELMKAEQLRRMLRGLGKVQLTCFRCLKRCSVPEAQWSGSVFCEHCYERASIQDKTAGFDDDLLLDPLARLLDEYLQTRLVKLGHCDESAVAEARTERAKRVPRPDVCEVLAEQDWVDQADMQAALEQVVNFLSDKLPFDQLAAEHKLARRLLAYGLVSQEGVSAALQKQLEGLRQRQYSPLAELLPEGELTAYQLQSILPVLFDTKVPLHPEPRTDIEEEPRMYAPPPERPDGPLEPAPPTVHIDDPTASPPLDHTDIGDNGDEPPAASDAAGDDELDEDAADEDLPDIPEVPDDAGDHSDDHADHAEEDEEDEEDDEDDELTEPPPGLEIAVGNGEPPANLSSPRKGISHRYAVGGVDVAQVGGITSARGQIQLQSLRDGAMLPAAPRDGDAGWDLHCVEDHTLEPGAITRVPLGFASAFPAGVVGLIRDRSSMAQRGIHVLGGVIDSSYRGEWVLLLANLGKEPESVAAGERVAQVLFCRLGQLTPTAVEQLPASERGAGGFGSSGR